MTTITFIDLDVDAVTAGAKACRDARDIDTAAALSWLATRMRNERMAEIEMEAHELILERRIGAYGQTVRVEHRPHLRSVEGG